MAGSTEPLEPAMLAMKSEDIRRTFLRFFEDRGHTIHPSDSLVPANDPSLLFTGAGMNQFKDEFLGRGRLPFTRAVTTQKCMRLPDLDEVGRTPSHHTFFEMLGNFSFGDYFKEEAIAWADELLREGFGLERSQLAVTVYSDDDEAADLWHKIGYSRNRIHRCGEKDNFWPSSAPSKGPNGPCGPCSEIYFDYGEGRGEGENPSLNSTRFVEVWNLVFTQFERRDGGELAPLPQRNIDTGMGFERLTRVVQGVRTNFDTDLFAPILAQLGELASRPYGESLEIDRPMRRIADHIRAAVFCISEGVLPSNEKQGYVVRKILRRALADGLDLLGLNQPFLARLVPAVVGVPGMAEAFPELSRNADRVQQLVEQEEQKFLETYERGRQKLAQEVEKLAGTGQTTLPGKVAFFLWDTAGFPLDLTRRVLDQRGMDLDEEGYEQAMEEQRNKSRAGSNIQGEIFASGPLQDLKGQQEETKFVGHDQDAIEASVLAVIHAGKRVNSVSEGQEIVLLFECTPFYAEGGGQVGDRGEFTADGFRVHIQDTLRQEGFHVHRGVVVSGSVAEGDRGRLAVSRDRHRLPTMRNLTATHLVHWALRKVLGNKVEQRGSLVEPERLRFDFSHEGAVTREQLDRVEELVNEQVMRNLDVSRNKQSFEEALAAGAMALFGEKYGDKVRVVKVEDPEQDRQSVELCGGSHVMRTGDIGAVKIISESGVAAGVRRIEALTGGGALAWFQQRERTLRDAAGRLKTSPEELSTRLQSLQEELRRLRKECEKANRSQGAGTLERILASGQEVGSLVVHAGALEGGMPQLLGLVDQLKGRQKGLVALLLGVEGGKVAVIVYADQAAQEAGVHAGNLCRSVSRWLGGGGGGNPGLGRGQGKGAEAAQEVLEAGVEELRGLLGSSTT